MPANEKIIKIGGWPQGLISNRKNLFDFPMDALHAGENADLANGFLQCRLGQSIMSSGSLPEGKVMALYQVRFPTNEVSYLIAQVDTGVSRSVYACKDSLPTTTGTFAEIYTLGANAGTISVAVLNDRAIITEGIDSVPLVWGGALEESPIIIDWMYPKQVLVSVDGTAFYDITAAVCDQDSSVGAGIGGLDSTGYVAICTDMPQVEGFYIEVSTPNTGVTADYAETLAFDHTSDWSAQDLRVGSGATIAKWNQYSGALGRFETSGDVAVSLGPGKTCPGIVPGVAVTFGVSTLYVVSIVGDGTTIGSVTLSETRTDAAVDGITGLVLDGGMTVSNSEIGTSIDADIVDISASVTVEDLKNTITTWTRDGACSGRFNAANSRVVPGTRVIFGDASSAVITAKTGDGTTANSITLSADHATDASLTAIRGINFDSPSATTSGGYYNSTVIGSTSAGNTNGGNGYTYIDLSAPLTNGKYIYSCSLYCGSAYATRSIKFKLFKVNGSNYDIAELGLYTQTNSGVFTANLSTPYLIPNDGGTYYLGFYEVSGWQSGDTWQQTGGSRAWKTGDATGSNISFAQGAFTVQCSATLKDAIVPSGVMVLHTDDAQIDTSNWSSIQGLSATQYTPIGTTVLHAFSQNKDQSDEKWWIRYSGYWRAIACLDTNIWYYNAALTNIEDWTPSSINSRLCALSEAFSLAQNQMTATQLASIQESAWDEIFDAGILDLAAGLYTTTVANPTIDKWTARSGQYGLYTAKTATSFNTTTWTAVVSAAADTYPMVNDSTYAAVSFDAGSTWKVYLNDQWSTIALNDGGTWKYWDGASNQTALINSDLAALSQAMAVIASQWQTTTLNSLTSADWSANGGFSPGVTTSITWAFGLKQPSGTTAKIASISMQNSEPNNVVVEEYHADGTWKSTGGFINNTVVNTLAYAQSGTIMYNLQGGYTADYMTLNEVPGFWFRIRTNGTSTNTEITRVLYKAPCQPLQSIGSGQPDIPGGFVFQDASTGGISDYTEVVGDGVETDLSKADIPLTSADAVFVGYKSKFSAMQWTPYMSPTGTPASGLNTVTAAMSGYYWNGKAWTSQTITDGTAVTTGKTISGKGKITWEAADEWKECIPPFTGNPGFPRMYWMKFTVNATLTTSTSLSEVLLYPEPEPLVKHSFATTVADRLVLLSRPDAKDQIDISAAYFEFVWTGPDTVSYRIGGMDGIRCIQNAWNGLFIGKTETWHQLKGGAPVDFAFESVEAARHVPINTQVIVKAPTGGFDYGDRYSLIYLNAYGAFIATGLHTDSVWDTSRGKTISEALQWWDTNTTPRLDLTYLHNACGVYWPSKNVVLWAVPLIVSGSGPQTTNNYIIGYDLTLQAWLPPYNIAAASLCTAYHYNSTGPQKLGELGLYAGLYDGRVVRLFEKDTTQDIGEDIEAYVETGWMHFDAPEVEKLIRNFYVYGSTTGEAITIDVYRDGSDTVLDGDSYVITDLNAPAGKAFTQAFSQNNIYSRYYKFRISFSGPTDIYGLRLNVEATRDWPTTTE